jgi:hypothetical protein
MPPTIEQMKSTEPPGRIEYIGEAARELLSLQLRGKVLAIVSHAAYLLGEQDELFWLAAENVPLHRRCIRVSGLFPRLTVDAPFNVNDHHLVIGSGTTLDFSRARIWETPRLTPDCAMPVADLPGRLRAVISILDELPAPVGFGSLIPDILYIAQRQGAPHLYQIPASISARAWPAVREIARACLSRDLRSVMEQTNSLIGLGEGLTPSGDDFVGGLLFCMNILRSVYPIFLDMEFPDLPDFIENITASTNIISYTFMRDHAEGCAIDTLHQLVNAILTGQPMDNFRQIASELLHIGHSTGWDLFAGLLTGMLLTYRIGKPVTIQRFVPLYAGLEK